MQPLSRHGWLQVRLFVELYTSEVQPNGYKILKAETQAELDSGIQEFTAGLKVRFFCSLTDTFSTSPVHYLLLPF